MPLIFGRVACPIWPTFYRRCICSIVLSKGAVYGESGIFICYGFLNALPLRDAEIFLHLTSVYELISWEIPVRLVLDEWPRTPSMISQHWFRQWLGVVRHQAITWANVDPDVCRHMASLSHKGLTRFILSRCFHPDSVKCSQETCVCMAYSTIKNSGCGS